MQTQHIGRAGEDAVCNLLKQKGCIVIQRNIRFRFGEIDILAKSAQGTLLVVEVKTRSKVAKGRGADAITPHKRRCLQRCLGVVAQQFPEVPVRCVLAEVVPGKPIRLYHLELGSW